MASPADLDLAIKCAHAAGRHLHKVRGDQRQIKSQEGRDVKLQADQDAENIITTILKDESPYPILGEESGEMGEISSSSFFWVVDPLDGTYNYLRNIPICCVSIALVSKDRHAKVGCIYDFNRDITYSGLVGHGAMINDQPLTVKPAATREQAVLSTGFPSLTSMDDASLQRFIKEVQSFKKTRLIGSAALSLAWVACNQVDAYIENDTMLWDVAGGMAIIEAAGGIYQTSPSEKDRWALNIRAAGSTALLEQPQ